jgi:hypothetical protein
VRQPHEIILHIDAIWRSDVLRYWGDPDTFAILVSDEEWRALVAYFRACNYRVNPQESVFRSSFEELHSRMKIRGISIIRRSALP